MAYVWVRPGATMVGAPSWAGANESWLYFSAGVPPQYAAERPCPLSPGCGSDRIHEWLDPVYWEYRDTRYPRMGEWPPPQPGPDYDLWHNDLQGWMPYAAVAYSGVVPEDGCSGVLGVPLAQHYAHWTRFDFASAADWGFVTNWNGIRVCFEMNQHIYFTNEGECSPPGKSRVVVGVYRHSAPYPAVPAVWNAADVVLQEFEYRNYAQVYNPGQTWHVSFVVDFPTAPGGSWVKAEQDRYYIILGQKLSEQGKLNGSDNRILEVRKMWVAAIADLGGAPPSSSPNTIHSAVVG